MAGSWAGAYGAGAASDELHTILAERLKQQIAAEAARSNQAQEAEAGARRTQQDAFQAMEMQAATERETQRRAQEDLDRKEDTRRFDLGQVQRKDELAGRAAAEELKRQQDVADAEAQRAFQREERMGRQQFEERLSRATASNRGSSEPLVAIKDPASGLPKLVPRSQAVGMAPASTRDQALTEGQANAAGFADRMGQNEQAIRKFDATGASDISTALGGLMPREFQSNERKSYDAAKSNWIAAALRKESGAAIGKDEYQNADVQYFPQRGDGPQQIEEKRKLRALVEQSMRRASGAGQSAAPAQAPGGPQNAGLDLGAEW